MSAKSLSWKPGEGANVGGGASSVLTRMFAILRTICRQQFVGAEKSNVEDLVN